MLYIGIYILFFMNYRVDGNENALLFAYIFEICLFPVALRFCGLKITELPLTQIWMISKTYQKIKNTRAGLIWFFFFSMIDLHRLSRG